MAARRGRAARASPAVEAAVRRLLEALPIPARDRSRPELDLAGTPRRVAEAWADELLDGYRADPAAILRERMPARGRGLVAVTGIDFHSMCPHHLLPSRGVAHVAYLPDGEVVGFGQVVRLVDCFAHRLVLEEDLAEAIAGALTGELGARGAAVVLDAEQSCLSVRGERRRHARAHVQCFTGGMERSATLQARFLSLARARPRPDRRFPSPRRGGVGGQGEEGPGPRSTSRSRSHP